MDGGREWLGLGMGCVGYEMGWWGGMIEDGR